MKIKKLEMIGFKSFVDRTVVNFDHDVLGIVGPNGCGKSNIVDAIRWCMGEQSAKHLRGRSMEDVIFNGSETRTPHDFAEVTLTFENDRGDVPIEYKDYPEIAITRRLYRSGDSEYLINKTQVRLKDVTDLFLGTGAGTKAYAIVEQGKIGLIVSAKAEDRRLLIEEAAGITKFKSKKKQAERKMELTQQNLLRVGDIVAEIERNLGSLKRQAAKAERYLSYRKELEDLQLHEASHRYLELTGWIKLEAGEVERLTLDADAARSELAAREAELDGMRLNAHGAEEVLDVAQNENFAAENELRAEESAIARAKDRIDALRRRDDQATGEAHELEEQAARLAHERDSLQAQVETLEYDESIASDQLSAEEERLAEVTSEQTRADARVSELRAFVSKAQTEIASGEATLGGFERRQSEMQQRLERLRLERDDHEGAVVEYAATASELERTSTDLRDGKVSSAEEKTRLESTLAELRQTIVSQERLLDEAKTEHSRKRARLQTLLEMQSRLEGVGAGVKALMATKHESIVGLVADRFEVSHEFTHALAGLLGNRLQDVVVSDLSIGAQLLSDMAAQKKGRATIVAQRPPYIAGAEPIIPVRDDGTPAAVRLADFVRHAPEDDALLRALVGGTLVTESLADARALRAQVHTVAIVTRDGTVVHADGRISGGQGEEVAAGMLESKRETRELAEDVQRLDLLVTERLTAHQASRAAIAETTTALDRARQQAHSDELALLNAEKDLQKMLAQLETVRKRHETIVAEQEELSFKLQDASAEREEARQKLDDARDVLSRFDGELATATDLASSRREQVDARRQIVTEKKISTAGAREKLSAAKGTLQRLARSTEELTERQRKLEDELIHGARALGETAAQLMAHRERLNGALDTVKVTSASLAAARAVFEEIRGELSKRENALKDLRARVEDTRDELSLHEMQLRERTLSMQHLLEGVAEKFRGLHLPRVVGDYHLRMPPNDELRSRVGELLQLLDRMGSVNLDAMREHDEAEKRYAFYSEQKNDLDKALADLESAIQQMNRESKRLFQETFDAVNAKFQELFPRMFRGGRASLRLTNPEDMLETGIDILAQPPGKKLSSIELMSGGEKALTAVSLIFAIFQIKPSPFCILDEVDAPLDEANVARYNEAIRTMTDRSQFILITHIKRTMQMVDVLYGVTMPEAGISKLVSVKMNAAAEKRLPAAPAVTIEPEAAAVA